MTQIKLRSRLLGAAIASLAAARAGAAADSISSLEAEQTALYDRVAPSVALLSRPGASGTGFLVADGLLVTNAHVVGDARTIDVRFDDGRTVRGEVVRRAERGLDLALVRVPPVDRPALALAAAGSLRPGSFVATVGHGGGNASTFAIGFVASPRPLGEDVPLLQAQLPVRPGSSGAPVVDRAGRVVAVVAAGAQDASGLVFAIRADAAARALDLALPAEPRVAASRAGDGPGTP